MMEPDHEALARRFQLALDLFEAGVAMMRQKLRREHLDWTDAEVEACLVAWLRERPGPSTVTPSGDRS